ncbi:MAG: hypothetical protein MUE57_06760 [Syntrophales bacterium]|nr:hypothetical protein [Syntrophales bacterium]
MPSIMAMGCMWKVGMAFREAHAFACLPSLNCLTWLPWQKAQRSGVGISARATVSGEKCLSPWQTAQSTPFWLCLLSFQSDTIPGVMAVWQRAQFFAEATSFFSVG